MSTPDWRLNLSAVCRQWQRIWNSSAMMRLHPGWRSPCRARHRGPMSHSVAVLRLINAYRYLGSSGRPTSIPCAALSRRRYPELDPVHYGLTESDCPREFETGSLFGVERATLSDILRRVKSAIAATWRPSTCISRTSCALPPSQRSWSGKPHSHFVRV